MSGRAGGVRGGQTRRPRTPEINARDELAVAPDGSPVAFYARVPPMGEPELIDRLLPRAASVLDLGCGPGRLAGPLARLGHSVTGVDNGPGMIAALPADVEGIVGDAASIRLGRRFDAVLLASHLINDAASGAAIACTAAAHVAPRGIVIGETYPPGWDHRSAVGRTDRLGDAEVTLLRAERHGDLLEAEVAYGIDGSSWHQAFTARILGQDELADVLRRCGLRFERWLERPGWFTARPDPS